MIIGGHSAEAVRMGYYDQMQGCENGHQITDRARQYPEFRSKFCKKCGAATIDACPTCNTPIPGEYVSEGVISIGFTTPIPSYCTNCGTAYPWHQAAIDNLKEILREGDLSEQDIEAAESTLPD